MPELTWPTPEEQEAVKTALWIQSGEAPEDGALVWDPEGNEEERQSWSEYADAALDAMSPFVAGRATAAMLNESEAQQAARLVTEAQHQFYGELCICGFDASQARARTEHILSAYSDTLVALRYSTPASTRDTNGDQQP